MECALTRAVSGWRGIRRHDSGNSLTTPKPPPRRRRCLGLYRCEVYLDAVQSVVAIQAFARKEVETFFLSGRAPRGEGGASAASIARRKLDMLDYAVVLSDLASPPGNRLEALKGDLKGLHSI